MKRFLPIALALVSLLSSCAEEEVAFFGSLSGLVKNHETKAPVEGAKVSLTPTGLSLFTGKDGSFQFNNLDPADYTVSFSADGYEPEEQRVSVKPGMDASVQVSLTPIKPVLQVSTRVLEFGKENTTLSVDISNAGKGTLEWNVSEDITWLSASPASGKVTSEKATVVFTVSRDGLENGSHTKTLVIASNGGSETLVATLEVDVLNLTVTPSSLDFATVESSLQLTLKNTGTGSVRYTVRSDNSWCAPNKTGGTVTDTDYLSVVVSRADLAAGHYNSTVFISTNGGEIAVPVKMEVVERQKPSVTLESVEDITYNSALAKGTLLSVGSDAVTRFGVCYGTSEAPTVSDKVLSLGDTKKAQSFQSALTGLSQETTYYIRAFAENSVGLSYSESTIRFTTTGLPVPPSVETGTVENITSITAKAKGTVSSLGNVEKVTAYGHVWGLSHNPTLTSNSGKTNKGETSSTLSYVSDLTALSVYTTYYVRAYATNSKGTSYGEEVTFTTDKGDVTLSTTAATDIIHNAATVGGTISSDGGNTIVEVGVCYGTSASSLSATGDHIVLNLDGNGFSGRLTGLVAQTNYYIRAYARTDSDKLFYANSRQFTTTKEVKLPTVGQVEVTNIKTDGATFSSRVSNNGNSTILENGFCWSEYGTPTIDNDKISCTVSTNFGTEVSGMKDGTVYYVRAWARNAMGTAYSDEVTFSTLPITPPVLSPPVIQNVNMYWAVARASVLSTGNAKLDDAGFCISTSPEPTVYGEKYSLGKQTELKVKFENLQKSTTYYVRAYGENSAGIGYSQEVTFTTMSTDPTVWDGHSVASTFGGGVGNASDPIIIATAAQLKLLANRVNAGDTFVGVCFKLASDIDWNWFEWEPIGNATDMVFKGVFDGAGYEVKNLNLTKTYLLNFHKEYSWSSGDTLYGGGFFGNVENATIVNVTVEGLNSIAKQPEEEYFHANGIAGLVANGSGYIVNCINRIAVPNGCGISGYQSALYYDDSNHCVQIINCVNHSSAEYGIAGTGLLNPTPTIDHSYWLNDTVTGIGSASSGAYCKDGNYYGKFTDSYSYTRTATKCLLSPSYTSSLTDRLNYWVNLHDNNIYGHLCQWEYVYIDGYACPRLIPED
ncbi:MAG: carboxypeptidase regulatory-like domain-containing protein [Bacteroidales bacterium]|nr:carboxypeptidase regulatory-like domain-containing protein [Bacteroidales bacterium]